jgi:hypothetical protein
VVEQEELDEIAPGRSRTIDIDTFVDLDEIDPIYFQKSYWLGLLGDRQHHLKFVERSLDYQVTHDSGLEYLKETHAKYPPPALAGGGSGDVAQPEGATDELDEEAS